MSSLFKSVASIAAPVVGNLIAPGIGGVIGGALGGTLSGGGLKGALGGALTGAGVGYGGQLGGALNSGAGAGLSKETSALLGGSLLGGAGGALSGGLKGALTGAATGGLGAYGAAGGFDGTMLGDALGTSAGTPLAGGVGPTEGSGVLGSLTRTASDLTGSGFGPVMKYAMPASSILGGIQNYGAMDELEEEMMAAQRQREELYEPFLNASWNPTDLQNDPGYQFQLDQGMQAMDRASAARGNFLSGRAIQDANTYAQGLANQTAQDAYSRWLNTQGLNLTGAKGMSGVYDTMGDIQGTATVGQSNAFQRALSGFGQLLGYDENGQPVYGA